MSLSDNNELFKLACEKVNHLQTKPDNDTLLKLYGYYKQATTGDCNTSKPFAFDVKNAAKWDAWDLCKGMKPEKARSRYILLVKQQYEQQGLEF